LLLLYAAESLYARQGCQLASYCLLQLLQLLNLSSSEHRWQQAALAPSSALLMTLQLPHAAAPATACQCQLRLPLSS
jgi:hypothetical protein